MWLNKYKPKSLDAFVGNRKLIYSLNNFYKKGDDNIVIINGQTGIGKSLLAELFLKENNYTIKSFSNCEESSSSILKDKIEQMFNFQNILEIMNNKKVGVIINDIDNILMDVIKIITKASIKRLVFIITNTNLKKLTKKIFVLNLNKPLYNEIENLILEISLQNKFYLNNEGIKKVYDYSNGDIRYIINFLEDLYIHIQIKKKASSISNISLDEINNLIESKEKDIDYSLYDLVNKLIFNKNTIEQTLKYVHHDIYFLPTIIYDNLNILLKYDNGLEYYCKCLKNIVNAEFLNIKEFENQNCVSNDIQLVLNTHIPNYYFNLLKIKKYKVTYSMLMNKLLKYNNFKKYYLNLKYNIPNIIEITYFSEVINFYKYVDDKKNKNKIKETKEYFEKHTIDSNKLFKYLNI